MSTEAKPTTGRTAIVVATAAVTLAIGVTIASLGGYLAPRRTAPTQAPSPAPSTPVLVPIAPDEPATVQVAVDVEHHERHHHHEDEDDDD